MSSFSLKAAFLALLSVSVARAQEEPTPDVCASSRNEAFDYEVIYDSSGWYSGVFRGDASLFFRGQAERERGR